MLSEFELAVDQICEEKGLKKEEVAETINAAIAAAFRKDYGMKGQNIVAEFDMKTGRSKIFDIKEVVKNEEEMKKPQREILLKDAKKIKKGIKVSETITNEVTPKEIHFGRIAAQTAKQVIVQRIREAEKNMVFNTFKGKEGKVVSGTIQRMEFRTVYVDLGPTIGVMPSMEQVYRERYHIGQRLKVYVKEVRVTPHGPEVCVSRAHPEIVRVLFESEVPEIANNTVEIKGIAREAGSRTKIAVMAKKKEIDPVGACVGQRGVRVQTVISELGGEKIDIIPWVEDTSRFIANTLSPAKIVKVTLRDREKRAEVEVREDQLSLAIGREGQNVRLAVKLSGWNIDILKEGQKTAAKKDEKRTEVKKETKTEVKKETDKRAVKTKEKEETTKSAPKKVASSATRQSGVAKKSEGKAEKAAKKVEEKAKKAVKKEAQKAAKKEAKTTVEAASK